ncbi:alpha/beta fold hydrolase [Noviherbaspirillum galbum]|uniref:Alpha/beta fold hydrolase n=1 Tax=Noviherbaspirillum galbum TaxID=2709383 RepID=A0A6B3SPD8_9BURK|nr:alpha/beta fold hydrolase [Noviherbaspirillum galbum]NEX59589.1 alpha/beta fold hydrolase [Noviherbaspirillum galbum]
MKIRQEIVQTRGNPAIRLHVQVMGEGSPVILLHGFPENARAWRHQLPALAAAGYAAWAPNLRGYPPSSISPRQRDYHLRHLVDDVAAVVSASGHEQAVVAGHDWGGIIAYAFAQAHPDKLSKLIILNAPHMGIYQEKVWHTSQLFRSAYVGFFQLPFLPERTLAAGDFSAVRRMFRCTSRRAAFSRADIDAYVDGLRQPGALKAALDYYRANVRPGAMDLARPARIPVPVQVIWGMRDPALGAFLLDGMERFTPRLTIHRIADAGHWVQNEAPREVNGIILDFLGRSD